MKKIKEYLSDPINSFISFSVISFLMLIMFFFFSEGSLIRRFFFVDQRDTLMDYMHSIEFLNGNDPYGSFKTLYPPLANLYYRFIFLLIPSSVKEQWPYIYSGETYLRKTEFDLRTYQSTLLSYIIPLILFVLLMSFIVDRFFDKESDIRRTMLKFSLIFSYGVITCIDRGNITFFAIAFLLLFVYYRNDGDKVKREIAVLLLAVAAGLKLYPALYGIMLLKDKQYATSARAILYGILSVVVPMFAFNGSFLENMKIWLSVVFDFAGDTYRMASFSAAVRLYGLPVPMELLGHVLPFIKYAMIFIMLAGLILEKREYMILLYISGIIYIFTGEMYYIFGYFVIALVSFLICEKKIDRNNAIPFVMILMGVLPLPVFYEINRILFDYFLMFCISAYSLKCLYMYCVSKKGRFKNGFVER